jgi:hypothetical protein
VVATSPVDLEAHGLAAAIWLVAARAQVVGPRPVTWETFLICQEQAVAELIVPVQEPLPVAPRRLLRVVLRPIFCITVHQLNPVGVPVHARVPATLPRTSRDPVRAAVEFSDPRPYRDKMVAEFNVLRLDPDKMAVAYNGPRLVRGRTAVAYNGPRLVRGRTAVESNVPQHGLDKTVVVSSDQRLAQDRTAAAFSDRPLVRAKMVAAFNDQFDQTMAAVFQIVGRIAPARAARGNDGNRATGPIIAPTASTTGLNGTIGARTITSRSTTTGATIGPIMIIGLITTGGMTTGIRTSTGIPMLTGGRGGRSPQ